MEYLSHMSIELIIRYLNLIFLSAIGIVFCVKFFLFVTAKNDNAPSGFFYNEVHEIHATNSRSLKKRKKLQNKLTSYFIGFIALLLISNLIKFLLSID